MNLYFSDGRICVPTMRKRPEFDSWVRKITWNRKWQLAPEFLPGKFHGQRSLVGYIRSQRVRQNE